MIYTKRESKNPLTGRRRLRSVITAVLFSAVVGAIAFVIMWSWWSVELSGAFTSNGIFRLGEYALLAFITPLCDIEPYMIALRGGDWKIIFGVMLFTFVVLLYTTYRSGNYKEIEHGSSHWATRRDKKPFRKKSPSDMPLADGIYLTEAAHPANRNTFVLAAPGAGKTFCVIIPSIEAITHKGKNRGSFFCTDTKGALYRDTAKMVRSRGYKTWLLNLSNPWYSDRYNPLDNVHYDRRYTEISRLALAYAKNVRDEEASAGDSIWEDTFRALMVAVWSYQYDYEKSPLTGQPETRALWRTAELIRSLSVGTDGKLSEQGEFSMIISILSKTEPLHPAVTNYSFVAAGAAETVASVIFTAGSKINTFSYPEIEALTAENDIVIDDICTQPCGVYLNFEVGSPYKAIAALFIEQLISSAYYLAETRYGGKLPLTLKLFLDELPNLCRVYSLPERASTSRSYGIDILISVQSMQQLERMFNKAEETLKNNCVTHIYLGTGEQKALEEISKALGKTTTSELNRTRNTGGKQGGGSDSDRGVGREIALPSEIYTMPDKYVIVKLQHHAPIFAKKFPTVKQKWYKELGGIGNPANSYIIEDVFRSDAVIRRANYYLQRQRRIAAKRKI